MLVSGKNKTNQSTWNRWSILFSLLTKGGNTVNLCAIDLSEAFDKVNHHALFIKLMKRNLPVVLLDVLENWLKNCFSVVTWNHVFSNPFQVKFGVDGALLVACLLSQSALAIRYWLYLVKMCFFLCILLYTVLPFVWWIKEFQCKAYSWPLTFCDVVCQQIWRDVAVLIPASYINPFWI